MNQSKSSIQGRVAALDWVAMTNSLDTFGCTIVKSVLTLQECQSLAAMYDRDDVFRSTIVMARHGFGRGEYKYWSYPLPDLVSELRAALYPPLASVANHWNQAMKIDVSYPDSHEEYLERCHRAGQTKPTPLLLNYVEETGALFTKMSMGRTSFPFRSRFCFRSRARTLLGANSS